SAIAAAPLSATAKAALALAQVVDATLPAQTCKDIGTPSPCPDQVAAIASGPLGTLSLGSLTGSGLPVAVTDAAGAPRALGHGLGLADASGCGNLAGTGLDAAPFGLA